MIKLLNQRQENILNILEQGGSFGIAKILQSLRLSFKSVSKVTINRDIKELIRLGYVKSVGLARATNYKLSTHYNLISPIDVKKYFKTETDKRNVKEKFNFNIFSLLKNIFTKQEKSQLHSLNKIYQKNIKIIPTNLQKQEFTRLIIELSWKSSQIEGNTYSLLETEALIKGKEEAEGHKKEEAIMILNHKEALDYISNNRASFTKMSVSKIEDVHYLLTKDLGITRNLRKTAVGIIGTKYRPLDNNYQIKEALEKTCDLINKENDPLSKAVILSALIAYIQPFEDGNKRTSRLIANAILLAYGSCPLSYRNVNEAEYKKAVVLFYEQNNLSYFKQLFIEQFKFAVENYFKV
jgi:Fic family protein